MRRVRVIVGVSSNGAARGVWFTRRRVGLFQLLQPSAQAKARRSHARIGTRRAGARERDVRERHALPEGAQCGQQA